MLEDLRICIYYQSPMLAEKGVWDKEAWDRVGFGMLRPDDLSAVPTWFDVIIEVAPRLKTLAFSQGHYRSSHQTLHQVEQLSQSVQFTQLRELHLHWIHLTSGTLKSFLNTAKPTLRVFTLFAVSLDANEDLPINDPITSMYWQRLWDFFRDELSLQRFSMGKITSDPNKYLIQGPDELTKPSENAEFDAETAGTSFSEWIDSLTLVLINGYHHLYDREWIYQGM
ncbi:uncharacterized protein N7500_001824 [Penicillium coprophilum]|uniref:uncharacterized protein n=1 Tax=Penicillium coprophilum TaxID=36646 RepID=UPI00239048C7|nr:uncharacterized protein N7500_001824 [Penicillium coprophilum]KAJ5173893.1 hypothetical protein N7500_001824 [Penicillium coprophilum]